MPVVGFCFSFPLRQTSVNHGTLIKWNKGFTNANAVDEDPTELLEAALARQGMQVSACMPPCTSCTSSSYMFPVSMSGSSDRMPTWVFPPISRKGCSVALQLSS